MLAESSFQNPFGVHDWLSLSEPCQMFQKLPENSQEHTVHKRICPEQSITEKPSRNASNLLVYSRRTQIVKPNEQAEKLGNCLVYSQKELKLKSPRILSEHDAGKDVGKITGSSNRCDGFIVYTRKKQKMKPNDGAGEASGNSSPVAEETSRQCKICDEPGSIEKMLICDKCEETFHTYCCSVQMKELPDIDEWLCSSCYKRKQRTIDKTNTKKRGRGGRELKRRTLSPKSKVSSITMRRDEERYETSVNIGKDFQARVPDWSGPITSDDSLMGEPLEIDHREDLNNHNMNSVRRLCSIGNWLQCREEDVNGEVCGKWRRAPLLQVQTDDWECFRSVFWDPSHADCAVPQEMETSEILKQLKYIEMLRPRLDARRRILEGSKGCGCSSQDNIRSL